MNGCHLLLPCHQSRTWLHWQSHIPLELQYLGWQQCRLGLLLLMRPLLMSHSEGVLCKWWSSSNAIWTVSFLFWLDGTAEQYCARNPWKTDRNLVKMYSNIHTYLRWSILCHQKGYAMMCLCCLNLIEHAQYGLNGILYVGKFNLGYNELVQSLEKCTLIMDLLFLSILLYWHWIDAKS